MSSRFLRTGPRSPLWPGRRWARIGLYSNGIARTHTGRPQLVATGTTPAYLPRSRVLDPGPADRGARARAQTLAANTRDWLDAGTVPGAGGPYAGMVTDALLDLHALLLAGGASVAGWSHRWRYVWPRDASFVAVALATTGHRAEAQQILTFLQRVQHPDGSFEARYLPDGSGPPDARGVQADGVGWVLWAAAAVSELIADADVRARATRSLRPMIDRSTRHILGLTGAASVLPPPSSDFWEVPETVLTLGTAAPLLAGLEAAVSLYRALGEPGPGAAARRRAVELRAAIGRGFGPRFARYPGGRDLDAATAFLLPPFQPAALAGATAAWRAAAAALARPAGGLAPGAGWKRDGVSWTPQTGLFALVAAHAGDAAAAETWLTWLDTHRTPSGAIPEKVLADGSPAGVAPLCWSAACVVLAVAALADRPAGQGR